MNCKKAEEYAKKYEEGELNYIEKRKFEKHLNECTGCKKKYGVALLLGVVLQASEKTAVQTTLSLTGYLKKAAAISAAAAVIATSVIVVDNTKEEKNIIVSESVTEKNLDKESVNKNGIEEQRGINKTGNEKTKIRIISKDAGKEVEMKFDRRNLKIESRIEK